jgi:hypothetical protein
MVCDGRGSRYTGSCVDDKKGGYTDVGAYGEFLFRIYYLEKAGLWSHAVNTPLADAAKERISAILGSGGIIYYTPDSVGGRKKVEVSLLGKTMDFPTGVLFFASQTNAVILPFIHLYWRGNIRLIIHKPIDGDWKDGENYQRIMQEFAKILESYILVYPEQYMGIYGPNVLNSYYRSYKMLQR